MWDDPIVKEVRDVRHEIENECDGDFRKIYKRALEIQKKIKKWENVSPALNEVEEEALQHA